jgi:5-methylcytosine-specific restriction endonuclease McrA
MERVAGKRGNYPITVKRYFKKAATNRTPLNTKQRQIEHPESQKQRQTEHTIQEVTQQKPKPVRIFERDGGKCLCCGTTQKLTLDHITPQAMGGGDEDENLQTLCLSCNDMKGKRISVIIGGVLFLLNSWGLPLKTPMVEIKKLRTQERTQQFRKFPIPIPPKHIVSSPRGIPTLAALIRDEARVRAQANQLIRTASA